MQLTAPDIDGVDPARAPRQENLRETAGRGAQIETRQAPRIDPEAVEPGLELEPAARHPRVRRLRGDDGTGVERFRCLAHGRAIRRDETGLDGGLRLGAAIEESSFDEKEIGALA
jgi:hypothetical protein